MARLAGIRNSDVQADRIGAAEAFARKHGCCLVLKGARTVVAEPDGQVHINPTGNAALSSGGSGDVLTGLIAGFLARGWPPGKAAVTGVYLHGLAADRLSEDMGQSGILAGELLDVIPGLASSLARAEWPLRQPRWNETFIILSNPFNTKGLLIRALEEKTFTITTESDQDTIRVGQEIGRLLLEGDVVGLAGELGSGKTWLTKGIALGLG